MCVVLGNEPRASVMLGKCSATELPLQPQSAFLKGDLESDNESQLPLPKMWALNVTMEPIVNSLMGFLTMSWRKSTQPLWLMKTSCTTDLRAAGVACKNMKS